MFSSGACGAEGLLSLFLLLNSYCYGLHAMPKANAIAMAKAIVIVNAIPRCRTYGPINATYQPFVKEI